MRNKDGFTLVELIISISLISIVVIFLFRLFIDLEYSNRESNFSRENQQNRAIIIKKIQDDFLDYGLIGLNDNFSTASKLVIHFDYIGNKTGVLTIEESSVTYQDASGSTEKWLLTKENSYMKYNLTCVKYIFDEATDGDFFYIYFSIPLNYKKEKKNSIDDLEFSYIGEKYKVDTTNFVKKNSLGYYDNSTCSN